MRAFNRDDQQDKINLMREIAEKAKDGQPLDGEEAQLFFGYALGLEMYIQALSLLVPSVPAPAKDNDNIIFEGGD